MCECVIYSQLPPYVAIYYYYYNYVPVVYVFTLNGTVWCVSELDPNVYVYAL